MGVNFAMVGFAYSADEACDYNYMLIKAYNYDDHMFIDKSYPCEIYRVNRKTKVSELLYTDKTDGTRYLRLSLIYDICNNLEMAEYKNNYPTELSWSVNPSGICEIKGILDMDFLWPLTPYCVERGIDYINITEFLLDNTPAILKNSFVSDVINYVMYYSGLYEGDYIKCLGNHIFCSFGLASVLSSCFGIKGPIKKAEKYGPECKESATAGSILNNIKQIDLVTEYSGNFNSQELCKIKTDAVIDIVAVVKERLNEKITPDEFIYEIKNVFNKSFERINNQKDNFVFYSGGMEPGSMNYLSYNELMGLYTFGSRKKEFSDIIKINRRRSRYLKTLETPDVIYKCKLIFDNNK